MLKRQLKNAITIIAVTTILLLIISFFHNDIPQYHTKMRIVNKIHSGKIEDPDYVFDPEEIFTGTLIGHQGHKGHQIIYGGIKGHEDVLFFKYSSEYKEHGIYYYDGYLYSEDDVSEAETFMYGVTEMREIQENWYKVRVELSP